MLWGLADRFVDELIEVYRSRDQAERALRAVLTEEPDWIGMIEVVPVAPRPCKSWVPGGRPVRAPRCRLSHRR